MIFYFYIKDNWDMKYLFLNWYNYFIIFHGNINWLYIEDRYVIWYYYGINIERKYNTWWKLISKYPMLFHLEK